MTVSKPAQHVAVVTGNDKIETILAGAGITDVTLYGTSAGAAGEFLSLTRELGFKLTDDRGFGDSQYSLRHALFGLGAT